MRKLMVLMLLAGVLASSATSATASVNPKIVGKGKATSLEFVNTEGATRSLGCKTISMVGRFEGGSYRHLVFSFHKCAMAGKCVSESAGLTGLETVPWRGSKRPSGKGR